MKVFIGEEKITTSFNIWLEKYGFSARVDGMEPDFAWYRSDNTIVYTFVMSEIANEKWNSLLFNELDCQYKIDPFWSSFLHELGHSETVDFISDEDWRVSDDLSYEEYFHTVREITATKWAVNFINTNPSAVQDLIDLVMPSINEFMKKNFGQS